MVIGGSNVNESINESYIKESFKLTSPLERYDFSYAKLKALSDMDTNTEVVILGLFYAHPTMERSKLLSYVGHYYHCFLYYPFLKKNIDEYKHIFKPETYTRVVLNHDFGILTSDCVAEIKEPFFTGKKISSHPINKIVASSPVQWKEAINGFYDKKTGDLKEISPFFISDLNEIKELCLQKGYKLILYNHPIHKDLYDHFPEVYKYVTDSVANSIADNRNIFYLNYSQYPLPDSCFCDCMHTNISGANIITPILRDTLISLGIIQRE
jgi:hypothetical protein